MPEKTTIIPLKLMLIEDSKLGGYTAFFQEYPECIAEGNTLGEAVKNLGEIFYLMEKDGKNNAPTKK